MGAPSASSLWMALASPSAAASMSGDIGDSSKLSRSCESGAVTVVAVEAGCAELAVDAMLV